MSTLERSTLTLTPETARVLTDEVKADAAALWAKLLRLYEGGAHTALGYGSWASYCADEFDMGRDYSYKLLASARVVEALGESTNVDSLPKSEAVARELVPVLREAPEEIEEVWAEVVEEHGPAPTARQTREVVGSRTRKKSDPARRFEQFLDTSTFTVNAVTTWLIDSALENAAAPEIRRWEQAAAKCARQFDDIAAYVHKVGRGAQQ